MFSRRRAVALIGGDAEMPWRFNFPGPSCFKAGEAHLFSERNPVRGVVGSIAAAIKFVQHGWRGELSAGDSRNRV